MRTLALAAGTAGTLALMAAVTAAHATPVPFSDTTPGATTFTVPNTGLYDIAAVGAVGGGVLNTTHIISYGMGGMGADVSGDFTLTAGEMLSIVVGGSGGIGLSSGGGGGGSFVVAPGNTPLVIAGGGGADGNGRGIASSGGAGGTGGATDPSLGGGGVVAGAA